MRNLKYLLLLPMMFVLTACPLTLRNEEEVNEQKQVREQISTMQKSKADSDLRYTDIQNDIRVIAGRVDAVDHNLSVSNKSQNQEIESLKKLIEAQNEKIKIMQARMEASEAKYSAAINALSSAPSSDSVSKDEEAAPKKKSNSGEGGPFDEAENLLKQKEFKKALVKYKAYVDKNPKGKLVADATYKMGVCFSELGLKQDAKEFFKDVIDNYPGTPWAKKAKIRLSHLK